MAEMRCADHIPSDRRLSYLAWHEKSERSREQGMVQARCSECMGWHWPWEMVQPLRIVGLDAGPDGAVRVGASGVFTVPIRQVLTATLADGRLVSLSPARFKAAVRGAMARDAKQPQDPGRPFTPEEALALTLLAEPGATLRAVAKETGVSVTNLRRWAAAAGITMASKGGRPPKRPTE